MKISAVLITKEKEYPKQVLDSLPPLAFDEYIIETECPYIYRRYELAAKASNDLVYVQDDDCLVDVKALKRHFNGQLTNFITEHHKNFYGQSGITLIGWGALFSKTKLDFSRYIGKFGMSDLFKREADRVFTYLNQPFNSIVTEVQHLPTATNPDRMSIGDDHWASLNQIKEQLCTLKP